MHAASFQDAAHFLLGGVPGDGVHIVWPALLGPNRGRYFLLTGQSITASEAQGLGIVAPSILDYGSDEQIRDYAMPILWGDAETIEFVTGQTRGVGTRMRVPTRIGPLRSTDLMTVVEWEEGSSIGVEHVGAVAGVGRFALRPSGAGTELSSSLMRPRISLNISSCSGSVERSTASR